MKTRDSRWEHIADQSEPSWYLDPIVAEQKRRVHQMLIADWSSDLHPGRVLKTDVFEEAYGEDQILFDLFPLATMVIGVDLSVSTAARARRRCRSAPPYFVAGDVRNLPFPSGSVDLIVSNSTLDHFDSAAEFQNSLSELVRILRPGGRLIVTMDNLSNPLYRLLRALSRSRWSPFPLGYTTSRAGLVKSLEENGLKVTATSTVLHNPRLISTALFLVLRRLLRKRADAPVRLLVRLFAQLEKLPTRELTACWMGACAQKPPRKPGTDMA